jgi:hypothetical protein
MYVLLITWFYYGQPPVISREEFNTPAACETARLRILDDGNRMKREALTAEASQSGNGDLAAAASGPIYPTVSAVCFAK